MGIVWVASLKVVISSHHQHWISSCVPFTKCSERAAGSQELVYAAFSSLLEARLLFLDPQLPLAQLTLPASASTLFQLCHCGSSFSIVDAHSAAAQFDNLRSAALSKLPSSLFSVDTSKNAHVFWSQLLFSFSPAFCRVSTWWLVHCQHLKTGTHLLGAHCTWWNKRVIGKHLKYAAWHIWAQCTVW